MKTAHVLTFLILLAPAGSYAQTTMTPPVYQKPVYTPEKSVTIQSAEVPTPTKSATAHSAEAPTPTRYALRPAPVTPRANPVTGTPDEKRARSAAALADYDAYVAAESARLHTLAANINQPASAGSPSAREQATTIVESFVTKGEAFLRNYDGFIKMSSEVSLGQRLNEYRALAKKLRGE